MASAIVLQGLALFSALSVLERGIFRGAAVFFNYSIYLLFIICVLFVY